MEVLRFCVALLALAGLVCGDCPAEKPFQCSNGPQCISKSRLCDGYKNCADGSDETVTQCGENCEKVSGGGFQCSDGQQCTKADKKCDGKDVDCNDASDETIETCGK